MGIKILAHNGTVLFDDDTATTASVEYISSRLIKNPNSGIVYDYSPGNEGKVDIKISYFDKDLNIYVPVIDKNKEIVSALTILKSDEKTAIYKFNRLSNYIKVKIEVNFQSAGSMAGNITVKYIEEL